MDYFAPYRQAVSEANDIQNNNLAQAYKLHEFETKQKAAKLAYEAEKLKFDAHKRQMDLQEQARVAATEAQPTPNPEYANWQAAQFGPPKPVYDFSASKGLEEQVNAFPALAKLNGADARLAEMKAQAPVAYTVPPAAGVAAPPQTHPANQIKTYIDTVAAQDPALAMEMKANLWEKYSKAIPPGVSEADKLEHFKSFFGDDWKYTPTKKDLMAVSKNQKIIDSAGNVVFDNTQDPTQYGEILTKTMENGKVYHYVLDENGLPKVLAQDAPRVHVSVGGGLGGKADLEEKKIALKELPKLRQDAEAAKLSYPKIKRMREILDSGNAGDATSKLREWLAPLAPESKSMNEAALFQLFAKMVSGPQRTTIIGTGPQTDKEGALLTQIGGGGTQGRAALRELLAMHEAGYLAKRDEYNSMLENAGTKIYKPIEFGDSGSTGYTPSSKKVGAKPSLNAIFGGR